MKNLLTLLLLVMSLLASGQLDSQSLEVEIQYWKSIAESNDTVAYREYLQRYGENGLYKDEANTRITLLKTSGKQAQSKSIECCFYSRCLWNNEMHDVSHVVRFDAEQSKIWLKRIDYDIIRSNLAKSRDFYENQATIALSRGTPAYEQAIKNDERALNDAEYARKTSPRKKKEIQKKEEILKKAEQAKSPEDYKNAWTADEEYQYDPMKSTSAKDVYYKRYYLHEIEFVRYCRDEYGRRYPSKDSHEAFYVFSDDRYNDEYYKKDANRHVGNWPYYGEYVFKKTMQGFRYLAFSKEKSSFIMWFEEDNNLDGEIIEKREYKLVPKEDLLPKAVNYDFLNE